MKSVILAANISNGTKIEDTDINQEEQFCMYMIARKDVVMEKNN